MRSGPTAPSLERIIEFMMHKKKIAIVAVSSVAAISILCTGALALFTDYAEEDVVAKGGSVDIAIRNFIFENKNNINPGDNDYSVSQTYVPIEGDPLFNPASPTAEIAIPTTSHTIKYDICNEGNEAAKVRRFFYISCVSDNGTILDPSVFFILDPNNQEISKKFVVDDKGNEYLVLNNVDSAPLDTVPDNTHIVSVKYFDGEKVFDGVGKNAKGEPSADVKNVSGVSKLSQEYKFGMKKELSGNQYQGASISVTLAIEGMQFKNTNADTWETIAKETVIATTGGSVFHIAPAKNDSENVYLDDITSETSSTLNSTTDYQKDGE